MKKAVFLDRDGVINEDRVDYVKSVKDVKFLHGVFSAIRKLNNANFKVFIVSNQSAINRKKTTKENVEEIHRFISMMCKKNNCKINDFYYCPHRPDENCSCRKPEIGLFLRAAREHKLSLNSSWMIGDKDTDIQAGQSAGCRAIKVKKDQSLQNAVETILNNNDVQVVILAGGFGTRLGDLTKKTPKPMIKINGKPFLQHQIEFLKKNNILEYVICVGYRYNQITEFFRNGKTIGVSIKYSIEKTPLGTGGALKKSLPLLRNEFVVINGDTYLDLDYSSLLQFHRKQKSDFTIVLTKVANSFRYGRVIMNKNNGILEIQRDQKEGGFVNAGVYVINRGITKWKNLPNSFSFEDDLIPVLIRKKKVYGYIHNGYFIDMGIPTSLKKFERDVSCDYKKQSTVKN